MDECPSAIDGIVEISRHRYGVLISGDPSGLSQLARLILWLAKVDQSQCDTMPDGERIHVHLYPGRQLTPSSVDVEVSRLDAKGTGAFPARYIGQALPGKRGPRQRGARRNRR